MRGPAFPCVQRTAAGLRHSLKIQELGCGYPRIYSKLRVSLFICSPLHKIIKAELGPLCMFKAVPHVLMVI